MADGRYAFRECVADGQVIIGDISPNQLMRRPWHFYVNRPPQALSNLDNGTSSRQIVRGYDGQWLDDNGNLLATVNTMQAVLTFNTEKYQEPGNRQAIAIPMGFACEVNFQEAVVRDADLLGPLLDAISNGTDVTFNFQFFIKGRS